MFRLLTDVFIQVKSIHSKAYSSFFNVSLVGRMFGMVLEKIVIPEVQKVSGQVEKKICAVGITKILTECPAMMDTEYTKLW